MKFSPDVLALAESDITALRHEAMTQLRKDVLETWRDNQSIPHAVLRLISRENDFNILILSHPFHEKRIAINQVDDAFRILSGSRLRIVDLAGSAHFRFSYADQGHRGLLDQLSDELYKFSLAARTLIEMYRRVWKHFPSQQSYYDELKDRFFQDRGLASFVNELRNNYGHSFIATPKFKGSMSLGEPDTARTEVFLAIDQLQRYGTWNSSAKEFIKGRERLSVIEVTESYFRSAKLLYDAYVTRCGLENSSAAIEYYSLLRASRTHYMYGQATIWGRMAIDRGYDVRTYFHTLFSEDDVLRLKCFKPGGGEEFTYLMSLADPVGVLDEKEKQRIWEVLNPEKQT